MQTNFKRRYAAFSRHGPEGTEGDRGSLVVRVQGRTGLQQQQRTTQKNVAIAKLVFAEIMLFLIPDVVAGLIILTGIFTGILNSS
jgi:hypothetical protein